MGWASAIGTVVGGLIKLGTYDQQRKQENRQYKLAKEQMAMAKREAEMEEQARNKADQREVDIESLLTDNEAVGLPETNLTGAKGAGVIKPLNAQGGALGGI